MRTSRLSTLFLAAALAAGSAGPVMAATKVPPTRTRVAPPPAANNDAPEIEVVATAAVPGANISATRELMSMAKDDSAEDNPKLQEEYAAKARVLLTQGADPSYNNAEALMYAAKNGQLPLVKVMVEEGHVDLNSRNGQALLLAAMRGRDDVVNYLVATKGMDPNGVEKIGRPLAHAAGNEYLSTIELLVKLGADINIKEGYPLGIASNLGALKGVEKLIELKADINAGQGLALRAAAEGGNIDVVKFLLEKGADASLMGVSEALTELTTDPARFAKPEHKEIAALLQKAREGKTGEKTAVAAAPATQPAEAAQTVTEVMNKAASPEVATAAAPAPAVAPAPSSLASISEAAMQELKKAEAAAPKKQKSGIEQYEGTLQFDEHDGWLLSAAAGEGDLEKMKSLLGKKSADPDFNDGLPLYSAAEQGHLDALKLLLDSGANINANRGITLIAAADTGHKEIVRFLIDHGIDIFSNDAELFLEQIQIMKASPEYKDSKYSQPVYDEMVDMINAARKAKKPDYIPKVYQAIRLDDGLYKSTVGAPQP